MEDKCKELDLDGKKVKINIIQYLKNKKVYNEDYIKFIEDSKDKIFTAIEMTKILYAFQNEYNQG